MSQGFPIANSARSTPAHPPADPPPTHSLIRETGSQVIDLPKLPLRVTSTLLQQRLSFAAGKSYQGKGFSIVEQAAVKTFLRAAYANFEQTGYVSR